MASEASEIRYCFIVQIKHVRDMYGRTLKFPNRLD